MRRFDPAAAAAAAAQSFETKRWLRLTKPENAIMTASMIKFANILVVGKRMGRTV
ncbi:hypothetical protein [Rhizobium sp. TRM95796]|uniref:hypothetical protein n=1 Tax=Rhizobium sp. TRM95796 TaxID=2979862 RepID=UPI0021E74946|nr:hypothetical protein [Rhizobium sp. TRM95796]MCV3764534.1 hypothetical protein [Rhizobium sp. TRM95796]